MFKMFKKKKENVVIAPIEGTVIALEQVPDQVFSTKMMGDGVAIDTTGNQLFAPCNGTISVIAPTKHAIGMVLENKITPIIVCNSAEHPITKKYENIKAEANTTIIFEY